MEKGKGRRRGKWRRKDERDAKLLSFCWFAHRGTHAEHLRRASYDAQVASV